MQNIEIRGANFENTSALEEAIKAALKTAAYAADVVIAMCSVIVVRDLQGNERPCIRLVVDPEFLHLSDLTERLRTLGIGIEVIKRAEYIPPVTAQIDL